MLFRSESILQPVQLLQDQFDLDAYVNKVFPEGTKILVSMSTGYCGSDGHEFYVLTQDHTQGQLDNIMWQLAVAHAEQYGYYPAGEYDREDGDEDEDGAWDGDTYTDNIEGSFEVYDSEKHDGYIVGCRGTPYFNKL